MPISAAMFRSDRKNPVPQCPPRLDVQMLTPVIWSRMPNRFLSPETSRVSERLGWMVQCTEPLIMMALHIPEENRLITAFHWFACPCLYVFNTLWFFLHLQVYRYPGAFGVHRPAEVPPPHAEALWLRVCSGKQPRIPRPLQPRG